MFVGFTDEQRAMRDAVRGLFADLADPSELRDQLDGRDADVGRCWKQMADIGILGLCVPVEHGGLGQAEVDLVPVLEEAGAAGIESPLIETAFVAAAVLAEAGTEAQKDTWLPRIASGEAVFATAGAPGPSAPDPAAAPPSPRVRHLRGCDAVLVLCQDELYLLPREQFVGDPAGLNPHDEAELVRATVREAGSEARLTGGPAAAARAWDRGAIAVSAFLNGISRHLLEATVAFVKEREQFGRPIGSFQAVKHRLSDVYIDLQVSEAACADGAHALSRRHVPTDVAASVAKTRAAQCAARANADALQFHGAIAFTWEHDVNLWLRLGKAVEHIYGSAAWHTTRLAGGLKDGIARSAP